MTLAQWRMVTAACLIVAGCLNGLESLGYLAGGLAAQWLVAWNVDLGVDLLQGTDGDGAQGNRNQAEAIGGYVGTVLLYWALALAASAPLLVAGGIQAVRARSPWLIATAGYVGFVLELVGVVISGIGLLHLPGLAGAPLAFITVRRMREAQRRTPAKAGVLIEPGGRDQPR